MFSTDLNELRWRRLSKSLDSLAFEQHFRDFPGNRISFAVDATPASNVEGFHLEVQLISADKLKRVYSNG